MPRGKPLAGWVAGRRRGLHARATGEPGHREVGRLIRLLQAVDLTMVDEGAHRPLRLVVDGDEVEVDARGEVTALNREGRR